MKKIRILRKRLGLTQVELARRSGITQTSISKLECIGVRRLSTALKLAKVLRVKNPAELFDV